MTGDRRTPFEAALAEYPEQVRRLFQNIPLQGGVLLAGQVHEVMHQLSIDIYELMVRLLPLASIFAAAPISEFQVGAVVSAEDGSNPKEMNLYLGANMEFEHLDLGVTTHAEQAAAMNAWHHNARNLNAVATSEPPCGYCRQFLSETDANSDLIVIRPSQDRQTYRRQRLAELLPHAITPKDLGNENSLMTDTSPRQELMLEHNQDDPVIERALYAAQRSYAPYTRNYAGCAIQTDDEVIINGRYAESVAFNPSLSPIHSALLRLNMATLVETRSIERAVLVEKPTIIQQRDITQRMLSSCAPKVALEYYPII